jgi:hypothetical protein
VQAFARVVLPMGNMGATPKAPDVARPPPPCKGYQNPQSPEVVTDIFGSFMSEIFWGKLNKMAFGGLDAVFG